MNTHRFSGCRPMPARNAKCPLRRSRLLAGVPAANERAGALVGEPSPLCTGMGTRKASAGQDRVPGRSLCLGCSAVAPSSCRRLFNRSPVFKESVPLPGWKHLCKCLSFSTLFHLYEWEKKKRCFLYQPLIQAARNMLVRECALCWAPICSNGPLPLRQVGQLLNKMLNTKI